MRRFATGLLMVMAMTVLTSCFIEGPVPYTYSPVYCSGCWHGTWEGREGWHYGGGSPGGRGHPEGEPQGEGPRGEGGGPEGNREKQRGPGAWHGGRTPSRERDPGFLYSAPPAF